eukprot:CAMPEP_0172797808 /NCGR_PEP_ID=MMETSP1075-20121228/669_1 /TAXON_ID=2916 /ORGANISM="Ceratium fusus, Strain PA161109" /LENGTH=59 /DNA_ID=CAMNT_0013635121 /DNA_START=147 /DNA_END=326 /DNA_ORIENTATION=-
MAAAAGAVQVEVGAWYVTGARTVPETCPCIMEPSGGGTSTRSLAFGIPIMLIMPRKPFG